MSPELGRFLQADPIGFQGDASNLYRYCGNAPVDRSDPTGLYAKGDGWTDEKWKVASAAQTQDARDLDKARVLTEKAIKGEKGSETTKSAFEKVFGKGSATKERMAAIAEKMNRMAHALRSNDKVANAVRNDFMAKLPGARGNGSNILGHAWENGKGIDVNVESPLFNNATELRWTLVHESGHNFGLRDTVTKASAASALPWLPPAAALRNADHVVEFALKP